MNSPLRSNLLLAAVLAGVVGCAEPEQDASLRPQQYSALREADTGGSAKGDLGPPRGEPIRAQLTSPPEVPPPTGRKFPAKVIVELEVQEVEREIADGVRYTLWTFGGTVPGSFIRIRQGDTVEFHLKNAPDSKMPHNIDLHAVTGPGGGAESSFTAPGQERVFTFKALNQGVYIYHCATAPVGMHIANGMYGMILVEPPEGLPPVDREYYVMQGDFYTVGPTGEQGLQPFDQAKAVDERPTYVLFNGRQGSLTGDRALTARVGERVRLFVGNGGPNLVSSFHVVGEIFDHVFAEGGTRVQENVQTTLVPAGGATMVDFRVEVPGTYALVDHSIFRAFNKGAIAQLTVSGPAQHDLFSDEPPAARHAELLPPQPSQPRSPEPAPAAPAPATPQKVTLAQQLEAGKRTYGATCQACHQADGKGLPNVFPPLAQSDFLMADARRSIEIVTRGLSGPITVNGQQYNSQMPPLSYLSDADVANVLTFVRNAFGNRGEAITEAEVAEVRGATGLSGGR